MKMKITLSLVLCFTTLVISYAQKDTVDYYSLSLEDLMKIEIVSASKKSENLFDAPLSASVLTREEIRNAGSTSIMEALRLVPGIIVRETSNGNYDITVRGLDNVPPNSLILSATNTTTLVMINNRPVYNYLQGGTFWESLPIDLNDVERIEVIRGPSSTLYGPNAVSGVINIITTTYKKVGWNINGGAQLGSMSTFIGNASVGYKFSEKFSAGVSGNTQSRGRDVRYLDFTTNTPVTSIYDLSTPNPDERYPHPDKSMTKYGVNSYINYAPSEKIKLNLIAGLQDSEVQSVMYDNLVTALSTTTNDSRYVDLNASIYNLTAQASYTSATQAPVEGMRGLKYDFEVKDATVEYVVNIKSLSIKPGLTYRGATYDDTKYWDTENGEGQLNGRKTMETFGAGVRLDYSLLKDKIRITGGLRADKFTYPNGWFASYQAAVNYKINPTNLVRFVYSNAYRSPFIFDTYLNYSLLIPAGPDIYMSVQPNGNKNLDLLNSKMIEIGYRAALKSNITLDAEFYSTRTRNYSALITHETTFTPANYPVIGEINFYIENIPLEVQQLGASLSLNIVVDKLQFKPFITIQKTTLRDYSPYFNTTAASPGASNNNDPVTNNVDSGVGSTRDHKFTPRGYGGAYINYALSSKFNFNMNLYWFRKHTYYHLDNSTYQDGERGVENIEGKLLLNLKVNYAPFKWFNVFVTGRNLLDSTSVEYYRSDEISMMILGGIGFQW